MGSVMEQYDVGADTSWRDESCSTVFVSDCDELSMEKWRPPSFFIA